MNGERKSIDADIFFLHDFLLVEAVDHVLDKEKSCFDCLYSLATFLLFIPLDRTGHGWWLKVTSLRAKLSLDPIPTMTPKDKIYNQQLHSLLHTIWKCLSCGMSVRASACNL